LAPQLRPQQARNHRFRSQDQRHDGTHPSDGGVAQLREVALGKEAGPHDAGYEIGISQSTVELAACFRAEIIPDQAVGASSMDEAVPKGLGCR
jgi:hypothetical protein